MAASARVQRLWRDLKRALAALPDGCSGHDYYLALSDWVVSSMIPFSPAASGVYELQDLSAYDIGKFPLQVSPDDVARDIKHLMAQRPGSEDNIAMFVRDRLWELSTFKTAKECPNCNGPEDLRAVWSASPPVPGLLLECAQCGWLQGLDGSPRDGAFSLRPATTQQLASSGLMQWASGDQPVDAVDELVRQYEAGLYTRWELPHQFIEPLTSADVEQVWNRLPDWARGDIELYVKTWRPKQPDDIDFTFGAFDTAEHAAAVKFLRTWLKGHCR